MANLLDFVDSGENNEETPKDDAAAAETIAEATADEATAAEAEEGTEETEAEPETTDEADGQDDDPAPWQELAEEFGDVEYVKEAVGFHEKFIAGDDDAAAVVEFAKEMKAISPGRYDQFVEMIVQKFAPRYGFEKAEDEDEFDDGEADDDYETDREKSLAEENAQLRAELTKRTTGDQQSEEKTREDEFLTTVGGDAQSLIADLNLHPETAGEALRELCNAVAATPEFKAAQKAIADNDGKRAARLVRQVQQKAAQILESNVPRYNRLSNALKTYDANTKPKDSVAKTELDTIPAARVETAFTERRSLPQRGAPLSAYAD